MKRRLALLAAVIGVTVGACASDTSFTSENGVCYRERTEKFLFVIPVSRSEVQSVDANCEGR